MLGECMQGKLKGAKLKTAPCELVTWKNWLKRHPETTCLMLSRTMERYERSFYRDLTKFVIIHSQLGKARAWRFSDLNRSPLVNDHHGKQAMLVLYDKKTTSARLFSRKIPDRGALTFLRNRDGILVDKETGSTWNDTSMQATSGPLKGTSLAPLVGVVAFDKAWRSFYPDGSVWSPRQ